MAQGWTARTDDVHDGTGIGAIHTSTDGQIEFEANSSFTDDTVWSINYEDASGCTATTRYTVPHATHSTISTIEVHVSSGDGIGPGKLCIDSGADEFVNGSRPMGLYMAATYKGNASIYLTASGHISPPTSEQDESFFRVFVECSETDAISDVSGMQQDSPGRWMLDTSVRAQGDAMSGYKWTEEQCSFTIYLSSGGSIGVTVQYRNDMCT